MHRFKTKVAKKYFKKEKRGFDRWIVAVGVRMQQLATRDQLACMRRCIHQQRRILSRMGRERIIIVEITVTTKQMIRAMMVCSGKRRQPGTGRVHDEVLCASNREESFDCYWCPSSPDTGAPDAQATSNTTTLSHMGHD